MPLDLTRHDRTQFASGEPALDDWLKRMAGQATRRDGARSYVICDGDRVIAYYSLCAFELECESAPGETHFGAHPVPAILLARLAVDREWQGSGMGRSLVVDAARSAALVGDRVGARVFVVHALHEQAADFYRRFGFTPFQTQPMTLYLLIKDVRETLVAVGLR